MRLSKRKLKSLAAVTLLAALLSGCLEGRSFHTNSALRITEPVEGDFAEAPLTIRWESQDKGTKRFAVFVDRPPVPVGKSVDTLKIQDRDGMYLTTEQEFFLEFVAQRSTSVVARRDVHQVTVVALTSDGKRKDDSSSSVKLTVVQP